MDKLSNIINKRLNQHKIGDSARASEVVFKSNEYLSEWLGCDVNEVKAFRLKNGVLFISTVNSIWSQEVSGVLNKLLDKLRFDFGKKNIKKILIKSLTMK